MVMAMAAEHTDQRILMHNMSWWQFETMLAARGDNPVPRMAYLNGTVELVSPSRRHENKKTILGCLVEAFAFEKGIRFDAMASTTLKNELLERGAEPDESYALDESRQVPDLAIEVVLTSGGLDKLLLYAGLGVREVWFWKDVELSAYELQDGKYVPIEESLMFPGLAIADVAE
jgi:Uma2 family endonuclease